MISKEYEEYIEAVGENGGRLGIEWGEDETFAISVDGIHAHLSKEDSEAILRWIFNLDRAEVQPYHMKADPAADE